MKKCYKNGLDLVLLVGPLDLVYFGIYVACSSVRGETRTRINKVTVDCKLETHFEFPRKILKDRFSIFSGRKFGHDII